MTAPTTDAASETLRRVRALLPDIAARAEEIEQARAVPKDIVESLRTAGVFRRYVPTSHGGDQLWPDEAVTVIEEIAAADASVGWVAAVGSEGPGFYVYLPQTTYDKIFAEGPDVIHSGVINPTGKVVRDGDGYRFSGRWQFASGNATADLVVISGFLDDPDAAPYERRMALVPADQLTVEDTWHVSGLKGTGSSDIVLKDLFVPEDWTSDFVDMPAVGGPLDHRPLGARFGLEFAAVAVGCAQGALNDIIKIAKDKIPATATGKLAGDPVLQYKLGELWADLETARSILHQIAREDQAGVGSEVGEPYVITRRAKLSRVGSVAAGVVSGAYDLSGTTGLFESCPLQRRLRDVRGVTQHYMLSARSAFGPVGAGLLG